MATAHSSQADDLVRQDENDDAACVSRCPCCATVSRQVPVGQVGAQQADGADVDVTTWRCDGCGGAWSGEPDRAA